MPEDIREAKQIFNSFKLETLCRALKQHDDEDDSTPIEKLSRRVEMTKKNFLQHYQEAAFFHEFFEDGLTYSAAIEALKKRDEAVLRQKTIAKLRSILRKFKKRPSLKYVSGVGKSVLAESPSA